jgi:hypothetical protein
VIEHHYAIDHAHQDAHDVLDPDDRHAELAADPAQELGGLIHLVLVQTAQALVGEQELRLGGERLRQLELLERGRPEPVHGGRPIGWEPDQPECLLGRLEGLRPRVPALAEEPGEHHVIQEREPAERARDLERAANAEIDDAIWRLPGDLAPLEPDRAGIGRERAGEHVEDRALAGAVGADQADDLALLDSERHAVDGGEAAEALGEALDG